MTVKAFGLTVIGKNNGLLAMNGQSDKFPTPVMATRFRLSLRGRKPVSISNPENNEIASSFHSSQ
jgi:hypothetical protein